VTQLEDGVPVRVASANIHAKVFDDEVVVLDMATGTYFSLRGAAAQVWQLVEAGATPATIRNAFVDGDGAAVDRVLGDLAESKLLVADPSATTDAPGAGAGSLAFVTPSVEKFTDMQELLLLDPIHDVDEAGWPHTPG